MAYLQSEMDTDTLASVLDFIDTGVLLQPFHRNVDYFTNLTGNLIRKLEDPGNSDFIMLITTPCDVKISSLMEKRRKHDIKYEDLIALEVDTSDKLSLDEFKVNYWEKEKPLKIMGNIEYLDCSFIL